MPTGHQDHGAERERPDVVAVPGGAEREARVEGVLLRAVEGRVQPGAHRRVLQGVAGELPVGAVQDEGDQQQDTRGDVAPALAGGGAACRDQRGDQRGGGDLVRGQAAARAPAGDVARVRADEEGGEEPVAGLHGGPQADGLVVHGGDRGRGHLALRLGGGDGSDQGAELGALDGGPGRLDDGGEPVRVRAAVAVFRRERGGLVEGRPGARLDGEGAGHGAGVEARVGQREAQCVDVPHEGAVHDGHPLVGGDGGQRRGGVFRAGSGADVEAEGAQLVGER